MPEVSLARDAGAAVILPTMSANPHSDANLAQVLDALQQAAAVDFEQARPIPPALNHSRAFLDYERRAIFEREWICVGRDDELESTGDFLTHDGSVSTN